MDNPRSKVMFWNYASKTSSAVFRKQACLSLLRQSADARCPLLTKQWKESSSISSLCSFTMLLGGETIRAATSAPFVFFCHCAELMYQTFLKACRQNCKKGVFLPKRLNSSLFLFIFLRRTVAISLKFLKRQLLHCE